MKSSTLDPICGRVIASSLGTDVVQRTILGYTSKGFHTVDCRK